MNKIKKNKPVNFRTFTQLSFFSLVVCTFILFSCGPIKEPVCTGINTITVYKIGMNETILSLQMSYFNPNKSGIQLKEAEGDAWINNNYLGHFEMDTTIKIYGNSNFMLPVKLNVDLKNVIKNAMAAILNPEVNLKIEGKAKIGKGGVFIHYPIRYEGKQNIAELIK